MNQVLIVEDDVAMAQLLVEGLQRKGFSAKAVHGGESALVALKEHDFHAVITDINMKGMNGLELCERITAAHPNMPVLVITAFGNMESAIRAMRVGAYDFLNKPFEMEAIGLAVKRAVQHEALREEVKRLREEVTSKKGTSPLLGESPAMHETVVLVNRVAATESAVLVSGESGTGKAMVARAIHDASKRRNGLFISISCAGVPASASGSATAFSIETPCPTSRA